MTSCTPHRWPSRTRPSVKGDGVSNGECLCGSVLMLTFRVIHLWSTYEARKLTSLWFPGTKMSSLVETVAREIIQGQTWAVVGSCLAPARQSLARERRVVHLPAQPWQELAELLGTYLPIGFMDLFCFFMSLVETSELKLCWLSAATCSVPRLKLRTLPRNKA